jgi:hypothetical protein
MHFRFQQCSLLMQILFTECCLIFSLCILPLLLWHLWQRCGGGIPIRHILTWKCVESALRFPMISGRINDCHIHYLTDQKVIPQFCLGLGSLTLGCCCLQVHEVTSSTPFSASFLHLVQCVTGVRHGSLFQVSLCYPCRHLSMV